ncbi:MAG: tRNA uridine-5-carboxymethylaminomethyl(34) synthesis enzyme MnmG [Peptostreptococcaceae bacterium]|nr:tRNA uridine-5-carboxymethylaminomethyl(34) synthesis enzyme MnmG [Peptostreptococcaceae bacterium]
MYFNAGSYDIIVVGAGHAGCEAALASARLGKKTLLITLSLDTIAHMPCNPAIGGTGKSQLVRELDALGGQMGINIDKTFIQSRTLNASKGPAVQSVRAQADKNLYHIEMKKVLEHQENLQMVMDEVTELIHDDRVVKGVRTLQLCEYYAKKVILCTGVFLEGRIYMGEVNFPSGPLGQPSAQFLSKSLHELELPLRKFKTGTPARVHGDSIDFSQMEIQYGDEKIVPFSFMTEEIKDKEQVVCYLTRTREDTHSVIRQNLARSAVYGGMIDSRGPRYCPSIEDKVVRFPDKATHQFFVEPEGLDTKEYYIQGFSSSLPYEVQLKMYHTVIGLENAQLMRPAYAIEYDCIDPMHLELSLKVTSVENLYSAGQFNGTSGYEEAAAQGLMAAVNAARSIDGLEPIVLDRATAYIGVLIDDLVTKGTNEPYRMMTSRAEYRLLLRQDNADLRLTQLGREIGLVSDERYEAFLQKKEQIELEMERLKNEKIKPSEADEFLEERNLAPLGRTMTLYDFLKRPEASYDLLKELGKYDGSLNFQVEEQCQIQVKYEGYIKKQIQQVEAFNKLEKRKIPKDFDYNLISGLRLEAKQKLDEVRPINIGQASRISGVSPADISVLLVFLQAYNKSNAPTMEDYE